MNLTNFFAKLPVWPIKEMTGYEPCTTFWQDFSIADVFALDGTEPDAVIDTHRRSWPHQKEMTLGIQGLTEYIMVLNWKIWEHHAKQSDPRHARLATIYNDLWRETDNWAMNNLTGDNLDYYIATTD